MLVDRKGNRVIVEMRRINGSGFRSEIPGCGTVEEWKMEEWKSSVEVNAYFLSLVYGFSSYS